MPKVLAPVALSQSPCGEAAIGELIVRRGASNRSILSEKESIMPGAMPSRRIAHRKNMKSRAAIRRGSVLFRVG